MAVAQKNFGLQDYVDDFATSYSVRGEVGGAFAAVDGHAATYAFPAWGRQTRTRHVRTVDAQDATTFRTVRGIIYTPTAYAAIDIGDAVTVMIPGSATGVTYNVIGKNPEKQPKVKAPRPLADHA
jgi:hypothetical protein